MTTGRAAAVAVAVLIVAAGMAGYLLESRTGLQTATKSSSGSRCLPLGGTGVVGSTLLPTSFGAVKEYALPGPLRWANGITVAPDGSVWFGEGSVPGIGHLYQNGTLVEYPWPTAGWTPKEGGCSYRTGIWGVQVWNGRVWAADGDENALVGVDPQTGEATVINLTASAPQPYSVSVAPDGSLWFTSESENAVLGRVSPNLTLSVRPVSGLGGEVPVQVRFANASLAYFVALDPLNPPYGHLYSFDPLAAGPTVPALRVGGSFKIVEPYSVSSEGGQVWITQHQASSIAGYDSSTGRWTVYPTSLVNFTRNNPGSTLPYFVAAQGGLVWFNEHYANRIAVLNATAETLTEFSEANPPVEDGNQIQNDLTIAPGDGGLWFTSATGNYIGFVNGTYGLPFDFKVDGPNTLQVVRGGTASVNLTVDGSWQRSLKVTVSDSENLNSVPSLIRVATDTKEIPAQSGTVVVEATISAAGDLAPGNYTVAVTVSDGLLSRSAYVFVSVS